MPFSILLAEPPTQIFVKDSIIPGIVHENYPETNLLNYQAIREALNADILVGENMDGGIVAIFRNRIALIQSITNKEYHDHKVTLQEQQTRKIAMPMRIPRGN